MTFLLDVNLMIALIDPSHVSHGTAHEWFATVGHASWATCPITENGVLRVVGNARYPNSPGTPAAVVASLHSLLGQPGHVFWPDDISLLDLTKIDPSRLLTSAQVTNSYLLALARTHGGQLATLDRRLIVSAVTGGLDSLVTI
jgi:toxin-antitoxin system PIN domain toxin